jgi:ABC-type transport system involved in multi-copper enzyme maturation permease subunit
MKTIRVARRELSLRRNNIIIFCIIVAFLAILYTAIYPSLQHQATQLINSIGNVYKDVGVVGKVSFSTLQSYMALEMFAITWPILVTVFAASLSGAALSGEIEKGTLGMLLALPLKRTTIYFGKYLTGIISIAIFVITTITPIILIAKIGHMDLQFTHFATTALLCFLFGTAVYSLALFFSALFNEKTHLYGLIGSIIFLMYVINAVAALKSSLVGLRYVSFFHYFNANGSLVSNHISNSSYLIFISVSVFSTLMGTLILKYRDFII